MSKRLKDTISISRDLKIDEDSKDNLRDNEVSLKSITKNFLKEPLTVESVDKKFRQMYESSSKDESEETSKIKLKKKKIHDEKAIFYDIFIKPKENKIKEIIDKRNQKNFSNSVTIPPTRNKKYISNKITIEGKVVGMNVNLNGPKVDYSSLSLLDNEEKSIFEKKMRDKKKNVEYKNSSLLQTNISSIIIKEEEEEEKKMIKKKEVETSLLNNLLHKKFILTKISSNESKKNYFNQLIQIRPPEGINAVSSSPLMDNRGWAPSIPSLDIENMNTNIKDLLTRAKGGIKAGDITKESHMAFYLGCLNEKEKKFDQALIFYKKFFLSAKLLQDIYGTELSLNRIAVLFSNIFDFKQSLYYNEKHKDISTHNLNGFVAYYNCGICYRILEDFNLSIKNFETALKLAEEENDLESYTLTLAQLSISNLFIGNLNEFINFSNEFFTKNKILNHKDMELEMQLLNGYVFNYLGNIDVSKDFYKKSLIKAENISNEDKVRLSLCNIGLIEAERDIDDYVNCISEGNEWNKSFEPETISCPKKKINNRYDTDYSTIKDTEVSITEYKKKKEERKAKEKEKEKEKVKNVKKTINKNKLVKPNIEKSKKKKVKKKEENNLMIGGGEIIEPEDEIILMEGGGVMIDEINEDGNIEMIGGGVIIEKEESEENNLMIGGGEIIEPDDEVEIMEGGGIIIEEVNDEDKGDNILMIGGGEIIEPDDEVEIMKGGGVIIEPDDEVEIMQGGGVIIEPDNEVEIMEGGGVMIEEVNDGDDEVEIMQGGGVMIDERDNDVLTEIGDVIIEEVNDRDNGNLMEGGGVMIDEVNDEYDDYGIMEGGGVMIEEVND